MIHRRVSLIAILACAAALAGLALAAHEPAPALAAKGDGRSVELTIYNSDLALVKEKRAMEIPEGLSTIMFRDISARINPATVSFASLTAPQAVRVREQNFEYDLVEDAKLMRKFVGEQITVRTRSGEVFTGYLLTGARGSSASNIVLSSGPDGTGKVSTVYLADIQSVQYPSLPEGLITRPTLAWLTSNTSGATAHDVLVTYLTGGLSWAADYVAVIGPNDDVIDLRGWVTVTNESGAVYKDAKLKLVAGDVHQVQDQMYDVVRAAGAKGVMIESAAPFEEKAFYDYHLYTLQYPTTLKENQVKQIELLAADEVPAKKLLVYDGAQFGTKVNSILEFWNKKDGNLGMPLPKGVVRVSKMDTDGSLEFIGEDRIDHTPKDEKVRITLGSAFDVVGARTQVSTKRISDRVREETWKVEVRNHKDEPVEVTVLERMWGAVQWEITTSSATWSRLDSRTAEFPTKVAAGGTATITYTVRYSY
ncbi:MAG TPA: hypothetical protein DDZ84_07510 [Firmicutes bacterium]|nr:hypothetical protein [Bacillota bacterium]